MEKAIFHTPLGWVGVAATEQGIHNVILPKKEKRAVERELDDAMSPLTPAPFGKLRAGLSRGGRGGVKMLDKAVKLLKRYFAGKRVSFDLPLDLRYYTPFQRAVWMATAEIPYGETRSYAGIAQRIKNPRAARAVGGALGANPVPVVVP